LTKLIGRRRGEEHVQAGTAVGGRGALDAAEDARVDAGGAGGHGGGGSAAALRDGATDGEDEEEADGEEIHRLILVGDGGKRGARLSRERKGGELYSGRWKGAC